MADVEVLEFKIPQGSSTLLYLPQVTVVGLNEEQVYGGLYDHFSKWGLLYNININKETDGDWYCYLRYYASRAASMARRDNRGKVVLMEGKLELKLSNHAKCSGAMQLPLAKHKCEELANYYLGFNGWSSSILYHRREESGKGKVRVVSVVRLDLVKVGLSCEGAGKHEAEVEGDDKMEEVRMVAEVGKRAKGEALQAAWSKVVLIVVGGKRVGVEINTIKSDSFFYDPLWEDPVVNVKEADYEISRDECVDESASENVCDLWIDV